MKKFMCQICNKNQSKEYLTKCCQLFICQECKINFETKNNYNCICQNIQSNINNTNIQNNNNKKFILQNKKIFQIVKNYYESNKKQECQRCQQIALYQCKTCQMFYCQNCLNDLHINNLGKISNKENFTQSSSQAVTQRGFKNHIIQLYEQKNIERFQHSLNKIKNKQIICQIHKLNIQYLCQCNLSLCNNCIKNHKQGKQKCQKFYNNVNTKLKPFKQYQQEYLKQIVHKFKQIQTYKQSLENNKMQYQSNFKKQQQIYKQTVININQQFQSLKKMLELKNKQIQNNLNNYWENCIHNYMKNIFFIQYNLEKFNDYAKLAIKFTTNFIGLDYLDKKIKKVQVNNQFFNFKLKNQYEVNEIKQKIMNLSIYHKKWQQIMNYKNINFQKDQENQIRKQRVFDNVNFSLPNSQLLCEYSQNSKRPRPLSFNISHNQIQFYFIHLPYQNQTYQIQYGVGFKMKGIQIFKKIENKNGKGIIKGLNSSTKYRIRMRVKSQQFGQIYEIQTFDVPKFIIQPNNICKITGENSFQFLKQGFVYGNNPLTFGLHFWTVILNSQKSSYQQAQTACISIGVSNKQAKKPIFIGSTFNYGYQRQQTIIKIKLNCEEQSMIVSTGITNKQQQKFSIYSIYPIFAAIQNKSSATIHIKYSFNKQDF